MEPAVAERGGAEVSEPDRTNHDPGDEDRRES